MSSTNKIKGSTFIFTGTLTELNREEVEAIVKANGGKVLSGVSAKLNFLVVGEDPGSKLEKAKKLGTVKILTEKEFLDLLPQGTTTNLSSVSNELPVSTKSDSLKSKTKKAKNVSEKITCQEIVSGVCKIYDMSLQGLIHYILYEEGFYKKFLNDKQFKELKSVIKEYPESIFGPSDEDENYEEIQYDYLDVIYSESIRFVANKLIENGLNVKSIYSGYLNYDE